MQFHTVIRKKKRICICSLKNLFFEITLEKIVLERISSSSISTCYSQTISCSWRSIYLETKWNLKFINIFFKKFIQGILSMMIDKQDDSIPIPLQTIAAQRKSNCFYFSKRFKTKIFLIFHRHVDNSITNLLSYWCSNESSPRRRTILTRRHIARLLWQVLC